jgi:hypothetical protein
MCLISRILHDTEAMSLGFELFTLYPTRRPKEYDCKRTLPGTVQARH